MAVSYPFELPGHQTGTLISVRVARTQPMDNLIYVALAPSALLIQEEPEHARANLPLRISVLIMGGPHGRLS